MELRAKEEIPKSEYLIQPLPPSTASLHSRYLKSKCSSCFKSLNSRTTTRSINHSCSSCSIISYCSASCSAADLPLHLSSGECLLIQYHPYIDADARAAVRLSKLGLSHEPSRVGWLLVAEGLEDDDRVRSGSEIIRSVLGFFKEGEVEKVMAAVISNAVEIVVGEVRIGIGVYGLWFSWFNHSCSPNACYRFECVENLGCECEDSSLFRVFPASREGESNGELKKWALGGNNLTQDFCMYGPRIVVRSIKPIKKNEEVCIAYTDLLQPKAVRSSDLWSEYRFSCRCIRCSASPEMFIDYMMNADLRSLTATATQSDTDWSELSDCIDQTIDDYISDGNSEECCRKLEQMLSKSIRLHPLHYLSIKSYTVLSSAFKMSSSNEPSKVKSFNMIRASAAYSLLLACSTHYLFLSEPSLIASASTYWVNAGENILNSLRNLCGVDFILREGPRKRRRRSSGSFVKCISGNLRESWKHLVKGLVYLENVADPLDFGRLGLGNVYDDFDCLCCEYEVDGGSWGEEDRRLAEVAVCCMSYGKCLAVICWGEGSYLVGKVNNLILV